MFEDWAVSFVDQCLLVIENSSREQTRQETDQMDETLNEEEIAADCTISDTFQKMMVKCSPTIFQLVFKKVKHHVETRILEPAVCTILKFVIEYKIHLICFYSLVLLYFIYYFMVNILGCWKHTSGYVQGLCNCGAG